VEKKSPGKRVAAKPKKVTSADEVAAKKGGKGRGKGAKAVKAEEPDDEDEEVGITTNKGAVVKEEEVPNDSEVNE